MEDRKAADETKCLVIVRLDDVLPRFVDKAPRVAHVIMRRGFFRSDHRQPLRKVHLFREEWLNLRFALFVDKSAEVCALIVGIEYGKLSQSFVEITAKAGNRQNQVALLVEILRRSILTLNGSTFVCRRQTFAKFTEAIAFADSKRSFAARIDVMPSAVVVNARKTFRETRRNRKCRRYDDRARDINVA